MGMLNHGITTIRGNNAKCYILSLRHPVTVRLAHGAGVKSGDLVIILVGCDSALRRVQFGNLKDMLITDTQRNQVSPVVGKILAHSAHR